MQAETPPAHFFPPHRAPRSPGDQNPEGEPVEETLDRQGESWEALGHLYRPEL